MADPVRISVDLSRIGSPARPQRTASFRLPAATVARGEEGRLIAVNEEGGLGVRNAAGNIKHIRYRDAWGDVSVELVPGNYSKLFQVSYGN